MEPYISAGANLGGVAFPGLNRYFTGTSGLGAMTGVLHSGSSFAQNAWDDNPNKFQQLGSDAGDVTGETLMFGMSAVMMGQHLRTIGAPGLGIAPTVKGAVVGGNTYKQLAKGGWEGVGHNGTATADEMKQFLKNKNNFEVHVRNNSPYKGGWRGMTSRLGGTYRPMGWKGTGGMIALQMAVSIGAKFAMGFAGKVLDEAYSESKHFRKPAYDNRFFNTKQQDMSSYQQLGSAMESYENRMMSVARIYHAR